jgi:twitching motility protein PilU
MLIRPLFSLMMEKQASDLFVTCGTPIHIKINGTLVPINQQIILPDMSRQIAKELTNEDQFNVFETQREMNFSHIEPQVGVFRVNMLWQRNSISLVIRHVKNDIPPFEMLQLPPILLDLVMEKRGMILVVGSTGSGKSTTLASMIDYRNTHSSGHILTIEDPIEFLFRHKQSVINQREVGHDTRSYHDALMNSLREAPDLLLLGEIRDRETMQHLILHALTGHLCLSTLHANNAYHALSRIVNLFPHDSRTALFSDLSMALKAIISQRLVKTKDGSLRAATEILVNSYHISELIKKGDLMQIKEAMDQNSHKGLQTFERALATLYHDGVIDYDEAMKHADSATNLAWLINNQSPEQKTKENQELPGTAYDPLLMGEAAMQKKEDKKISSSASYDFSNFVLDTELNSKN